MKLFTPSEISNKYEYFCDMDGVLTDFNHQFKKCFRKFFPLCINEESNAIYDAFYKHLTKLTMDKELAGNIIKAHIDNIDFWQNLNWLPGACELWDIIKSRKTRILSSPGVFTNAELGKRKWCHNYLRISGYRVIIQKEKQEYSGKNKVLIDDYYYNIIKWQECGGIGILHTSVDNTIEQLKILNQIK